MEPMNWNLNNGYESSQLLVIVWSPVKISNSVLEQLLSCKVLTKGYLNKMLQNCPYSEYYDELGALNNKLDYMNADVKEKFFLDSIQHIEHIDKISEQWDAAVETEKKEKLVKPEEQIDNEIETYKQDLKQIGVSDQNVEILSKKFGKMKDLNLNDIIVKLLTKGEGVKKLSETLNKALNQLSGDTLNNILNFPEIYAKGDITSNVMKKTYIDNRLNADLDCFSERLTDLVLSGNLFISLKERSLLFKNIRLWEKYIKGDKHETVKKILIGIVKLLVNDAKINDKVNVTWINITETLTGFIVSDEEDSEENVELSAEDLPPSNNSVLYHSN
jgi:hypothetical protein